MPKMEVSGDGVIVFKEVFNSIGFETADGEKLFLCMRDNGFEFKYQDEWYSACNGEVIKLKKSDRGNILVDQSDHGEHEVKAEPSCKHTRIEELQGGQIDRCLDCGKQWG